MLERVDLLQIYYFMRLTRAMEDRTRTLFLQGKVVGGVYTAQGHEATTVGAAMSLRDGDCIVPQHRDLGMQLVRGTSPRAVMCQWLARGNSPTLGRDGQLHIGDMHHGIVPMISMLGESLPVACGVALAMKMRKRSTIVLASCGDGATNTGPFHEAMNFASVQKLPLVLVIENNGYAYSTPSHKQFNIQNLSERARAYGIPGETVDGNDVLAVIETVGKAVEHARSGKGPAIVECKTFRVRGHSEADKADYVPQDVREEWLKKDPINLFEAYLTREGILTTAKKAEIEANIKAVTDDAVRFAEQSPAPDPETVADYVFAPDGPIAIVGEPGAEDTRYVNALDRRTGQPFTTIRKTEEAIGRR
ncbi:pyruvate dehydrogenase E1 component alpha subunit/2-oxoisovalerate dehydrogenase E1 component alpha subunit [Thermosporothrix hazakensis]|jgi:TPP-dependent pyruvate/acetoin dehydrogenase alpha subunit|uniref:Pyruvate dehydrogenase E1 component alpha subunit/2-oxoisovalerate dehydrogenase E1 component alpha subunit n=2 Tax=Thermosporothrix TaxID=768650 RepID=A0A326UHI8_THEHA|nr:thiamine pyrophosphate-dependent dehydrogenase E1 component subunit alpha [Thermosporothrix hazakensis]PZW36330.1 pyruvate dehydrogenase E1 component alpha subunit/2-oxoisovalerate dehydrogenase E1 component alpha subunit [Thermosporothrix hazakensis]BBH88796.1 pyruvate dehydrogenase [Thermosporothrix sp. COM3]GCE46979.1 pyruvate dehydrogenase [Thermosporothrix hazakensis]